MKIKLELLKNNKHFLVEYDSIKKESLVPDSMDDESKTTINEFLSSFNPYEMSSVDFEDDESSTIRFSGIAKAILRNTSDGLVMKIFTLPKMSEYVLNRKFMIDVILTSLEVM